MNNEMKHYVREFFGYIMKILRERGIEREFKKKMIRNSGLIEKCRTESGAAFVLHYDVDEWCDYIINPKTWPYKSVIPNKCELIKNDKEYEPDYLLMA